jgi:hypothetical protein
MTLVSIPDVSIKKAPDRCVFASLGQVQDSVCRARSLSLDL